MAATTSLILHVVALAAVAYGPTSTDAGGGGTEIEAIGVKLVLSSVLESQIATPALRPAAAADAAIEQKEGVVPEPDQAFHEPPKVADESVPEATSDTVPREPPPPKEKPEPDHAPASDVPPQGGAQARGLTAGQTSGGSAAASPGAVNKFAGDVRNALAKTGLKGRGKRATVNITFSITQTGGVGKVTISKTSGDDGLDALAVGAIQRTAFPPPPAGMTEAQLTYVVPFQFR